MIFFVNEFCFLNEIAHDCDVVKNFLKKYIPIYKNVRIFAK